VWVGNEGDGTVSRIDPAPNQVVAAISIGQKGFMRLAAGEDAYGWQPASIRS